MPERASGEDAAEQRRAHFQIPRFVEFLAHERSWPLRYLWLIGPLAVATILTYFRVAFGIGATGTPLLFYLPAIIVTTLTAGLRLGIASLIATIALVWFLFVPPTFSFQAPSSSQLLTFALWSVVSAILITLSYFLRTSLQQLSHSETRYRKLADVTSDILWIADANGAARGPNPAWDRITGTTWPEYQGHNWLKSVHEEDRAALNPAGSNADTYQQAEFRLWSTAANDWRWHRARAVAITAPDGRVMEWITTIRDVHEPTLARERTKIILGEWRHRLKNLITIIDALAKSSAQNMRTNPDTEAFLKRFLGRLHALSAAADLALAGNNISIDLSAAARATLAPFSEDQHHIKISGPELVLPQETGGGIALAIHELATNAIKYGALSVPGGSVSLTWDCDPVPEGERVTIIWKESGGPAPEKLEHEGFGTRVIRSAPLRERDGKVEFEYPAEGLLCRISFSLPPRTAEAEA